MEVRFIKYLLDLFVDCLEHEADACNFTINFDELESGLTEEERKEAKSLRDGVKEIKCTIKFDMIMEEEV